MNDKKSGLELLREPFPAHQISKLPKPTKQQTDSVKESFKNGIRCELCGGWHHKDVIHLDYVGHAALTDRLLDCDASWNWEPMAYTEQGLPCFDQSGGLWIRLTVCGITRPGYGHAAIKASIDPGTREKEVIGDALRNAAMRFGAALDLWHKGDLHIDDEEPKEPVKQLPPTALPKKIEDVNEAIVKVNKAEDIRALLALYPLIMTKVKQDEAFKPVFIAKRRSFNPLDNIALATNINELGDYTAGLALTEEEQDAFNIKMDSFRG